MSRTIHILVLLIFSFAKIANSQSTSTLLGARAAGMGYSQVALPDEWSFFNNIAGLGKVKQATAIFAYEARPALPGANRMGAALLNPLSIGTLGIGIHRFGDELYNEHLASLGYGHQLGITSLGLRINYIQYRGEGFDKQTAVSIDFGGITQLNSKLAVAASIRNLSQSGLSQTDEKLPIRLVAGVAFKPDDKITLATELEKDIDFDPVWRVGLEYVVYKKIFFRSGYNLSPSCLFFGTGIHRKNLRIDYAIQFTERQGAVHQMSAVYAIFRKERK